MESLDKLYEHKGKTMLRQVLVNARIEVQEEQEYSGYNDEDVGHLIVLTIPERLYFEIYEKQDAIEREILAGLNNVSKSIPNEYICKVLIKKEDVVNPDWRADSGLLLEKTYIVPPKAQNRIWKDKMYRLFISHKCEYKKEVSNLKQKLSIFGVDCFVAHKDIKPTRPWEKEIENALFSMDACVAIMTPNYHDSDWTDHEIGCARGRCVPIIPVKMGKDPYGIIAHIQAVSSTWSSLHFNLMQILIQYDQVKNAYINAISVCESFECGNTLAKLFPYINSLSVKQIDMLIDAWQSNKQAQESFGFSGQHSDTYGPGIMHFLMAWAPTRFPDKNSILDFVHSHR